MNTHITLIKKIRSLVLMTGFICLAAQIQAQTPSLPFKEDFGGNDTPSTLTSGDWWMTTEPAKNFETACKYGTIVSSSDWWMQGVDNVATAAAVAAVKIEYGMPDVISIHGAAPQYAITKVSLPIFAQNHRARPSGDYTSEADTTRGYFMMVNPEGALVDTDPTKSDAFYSKTITGLPAGKYEFSVWLKHVDDTELIGTWLYLQAVDNNGTQLNITNQISLVGGAEWTQYSIPVEVSTSGDVTFRIIGANKDHNNVLRMFGIDDVEVKQYIADQPITITSPANLNTSAYNESTINLAATYEYGNLGNNLRYKWESSPDKVIWTPGTSGTSTTGKISATLNGVTGTDQIVYYRLSVAASADTNYSNPKHSETITLTFGKIRYFENFEGNNSASTLTSGDWWIPESASGTLNYGNAGSYGLDVNWYGNTYGCVDNAGYNMPKALTIHGTGKSQPIFAITKASEAITGAEHCARSSDDHTSIGDNTRGYFMMVNPEGATNGTVHYSKTISMTEGKYEFGAWLTNVDDNKDGGPAPTNLYLWVTDAGGNELAKSPLIILNYNVDWTWYSIPVGVSTAGDVTFSIIDGGGNIVLSMFGIDGILVTDFEPSVEITSPVTGAAYCQWNYFDFEVSYATAYRSVAYKFQYSSTGNENEWVDLTDFDGNAISGTWSSGVGTGTKGISFYKVGYYRVLITEGGDSPNYTNALASESTELILNTQQADVNDITIVKGGGGCTSEAFILQASAPSVSNPIFQWYNKSGNHLADGNSYTLPAATTPTSGTETYHVTLQYDGACESEQKLAGTLINCKSSEDFGGCDTDQPFIYYADNRYQIPGYNYPFLNNSHTTVDLYTTNYIITKQVHQHMPGEGQSFNWNTIGDHSVCGEGYFLQVHATSYTAGQEFYRTKIDVCSGSKMSFTAYLANLFMDTTLKFKFLVAFDNDDSVEETVTVRGGNSAEWGQYGVEFFVPTDAISAVFTIVPIEETGITNWNWGSSFAMDDINIEQLNPVQIIVPETSTLSVLSGMKANLTGSYACGDLTGAKLTYQWQVSKNPALGWNDADKGNYQGEVDNSGYFETDYETDAITGATTVFYRFTVSDGTTTPLASDQLKIVSKMPASNTYWVCSDVMSDQEAKGTGRLVSGTGGENARYLPGMVSDEEAGYAPSLLYMEMPELQGVIYKWYEQQEGGTALPDQDEYKHDQFYSAIADIKDPILLSDEKSHTYSAQNERTTESGDFKDRTYWVEICGSDSIALAGYDRIPIYLKQAYICASKDPKVSPTVSKLMNRENYKTGTDRLRPDAADGMDYIWQKTYGASTDWNVSPAHYVITNASYGQGTEESGGWYAMNGHRYESDTYPATESYFVAVDGDANPGRFYTYNIKNLGSCRDVELLFSAWLTSPVAWYGNEKAYLKFTLTDNYGNILSEFYTGNLMDGDGGTWKQYGFKFPVPDGISDITLTIRNNSFGTAGGNDVYIDDIEIYLNIPPVTLIPSVDSYICNQLGEDYGIVTLEGTYTDDGTLGKYLDYRWEYRKNAGSDWEPLTGTNSSGSVNVGVVSKTQSSYTINPFGTTNTGDYRLVVGQAGAFDDEDNLNYECMAESAPRTLTYIGGTNPTPVPSLAAESNLTAVCAVDGTMTITNLDNINKYHRYYWKVDGVEVEIHKGVNLNDRKAATSIDLVLADYEPGFHVVELTVFNIAGCSGTSVHEFIIYPETTTWTAKGDAGNWNHHLNWDNGIPGSCTDVIIPYQSLPELASGSITLLEHYPLLTNPSVEDLNENDYETNQKNLNKLHQGSRDLRAACDEIHFLMGGALARTDYLRYNFAYVDLDVKPNRWYTVSAPLGSTYTGDNFVIGHVKRFHPATYIMKYNAINPETGETVNNTGDFSNPFNTLTEKLYPGMGYTLWVDDDKPIDDPTSKMQEIRFPKDSLKYDMWTWSGEYAKTVTIPERDDIGRFTYESLFSDWEPNDGTENGFTTTVYEDKATYTTTMVGNPFMSHLNFSEFAEANDDIKNHGYYIYNGNSFDAQNPLIFSNENIIAPLQSFVVDKADPIAALATLNFTMDMAVEKTKDQGGMLRSAAVEKSPVLRMELLRNNEVQSNVRLKYAPGVSNRYDEQKDMLTLFLGREMDEPTVLYSQLDGRAASIRTIGDLSEEIELGIRTENKGLMTFRMSGLKDLDTSYDVFLEDRETRTSQDLRRSSEYTFNNQTGNVEGRFFLNAIKNYIDVSVSTMQIESEGGIKLVPVESNIDWTVKSNKSWVTVTPESGNGNANTTLTVTKNTGGARTAVITIKARGLEPHTITVTQMAAPYLKVDSHEVNFNATSYSQAIKITSNVNWEAESDSKEWLTITPESGNGNASVTLAVAENTGGERTAVITIKASGLEPHTITVTQLAAPYLTIDSHEVNFNATSYSQIIKITSNVNWQAEWDSQEWLTVTPESGNGNANITLTVMKNTGGARTAVITIKASGLEPHTIITVAQLAAPYLTVDSHEVNFNATSYSQAIKITSNVSWEAESDSKEWLTVTPANGSDNETILLVAEENPTNDIRTAFVSISSPKTEIKTISVVQEAKPVTTGLDSAQEEDILLYPNPVSNGFYVTGLHSEGILTITDVSGAKLRSQPITEKQYVDISSLKEGIYIVDIRTDKGSVKKKIVKKLQ